MADLALGALGVTGLVTVVLDIWSFVDAGQGFSESFVRLRTKLDLQRALFVNWCTSLGVGTEQGFHPQLESSELKSVVTDSLIEIFCILSKTDSLTQTYGLRVLNDRQEHSSAPISCGLSDPTTQTTTIFRTKYEAFRRRFGSNAALSATTMPNQPRIVTNIVGQLVSNRERQIRDAQRNSSLWTKTKWAVRDESKLAKLVADLTELVSGLRALTQSIIPPKVERELALQDLAEIDDVDQLRNIQDASEKSSPYSVSAGKRLHQLTPDQSTAATFYSARSRPNPESTDIYGTAPSRSSIPVQEPKHGAGTLAAHYRQIRLGQIPTLVDPKFPWGSGGKGFSAPTTPSYVDLVPFRLLEFPKEPCIDSAWRGKVSGTVGTPYHGGAFEVQLWVTLCGIDHTTDRTSICPESKRIWLRFMTTICHPLVSIQGHLQVNWKAPCGGSRDWVDDILLLTNLVHSNLQNVLRGGWETCFDDSESENAGYFVHQARAMTEMYATETTAGEGDTNGKQNVPLSLEKSFSKGLYQLNEWQTQGMVKCVVEMVGVDEFHKTKVLISST